MTYEKFVKILLGCKAEDEKRLALADKGIDIGNYLEGYESIVNSLIESIWTPEGVDWLYWFMYESDYGYKKWNESDRPVIAKNDDQIVDVERKYNDNYGAHDELGNPICYNFVSTYKFLKQYEIGFDGTFDPNEVLEEPVII
jgi:hypothetical protein